MRMDLRTIGFAFIGLPLLATLIINLGAQWGPLTWMVENKAFLWACGGGMILFTAIKDAKILMAGIILIYVLATII